MLAYAPRLVRPFPPLSAGHRTLKTYGIFATPDLEEAFPPQDRLGSRVRPLLGEPEPADHGLGFLMLHFGADGHYLALSEWFGGNMLRHRVYRSDDAIHGSNGFVPMVPRDVMTCVWELEVMKFERDAWVRTVMTRDAVDEDAVEAYLGMRLTGWV